MWRSGHDWPPWQASFPASDPGVGMVPADLPYFHLQSGPEVFPVPLAGEGALSQHLPQWLDPMTSGAFLLVF